MSEDKRLRIVRARETFPEITDALVRRVTGEIESFELVRGSPKMVAKLLQELRLGVEAHFHERTLAYVRGKVAEQIDAFVVRGYHHSAGLSEEGFREQLSLLAVAIENFCAPPMRHPIIDGEFTLLLVLPPEWVGTRQLLGEWGGRDVCTVDVVALERSNEIARRPSKPYALFGIDGGRALRTATLQKANVEVARRGKHYLGLHELLHLLLAKPEFLSSGEGILSSGSQIYALGDRFDKKLIRLSVGHPGFQHTSLISFLSEHAVSGEGVGKPYYTDVITAD